MFCETERPIYYGGNDGFGNGNGSWIFALLIFFGLLIFNGGFFGDRNRGGNSGIDATTAAILSMANSNGRSISADYTDSAVQRGFNTQEIIGKLDAINSGNCSNTAAINNAINGIGMGMMQGFHGLDNAICNQGWQNQQGFNGIQRDLCQGFNGTNMSIMQGQNAIQSQIASCCCGIERNVDAVRYENARNTCDIVNAIRDDGNATRALITQTEMQNLRDRLADRDRDIQSRDFQLSQLSQTRSIISELQPTPRPSYLTCSPYQAQMLPYFAYGDGFRSGCGNGWNGFNNGCGCGNCA